MYRNGTNCKNFGLLRAFFYVSAPKSFPEWSDCDKNRWFVILSLRRVAPKKILTQNFEYRKSYDEKSLRKKIFWGLFLKIEILDFEKHFFVRKFSHKKMFFKIQNFDFQKKSPKNFFPQTFFIITFSIFKILSQDFFWSNSPETQDYESSIFITIGPLWKRFWSRNIKKCSQKTKILAICTISVHTLFQTMT